MNIPSLNVTPAIPQQRPDAVPMDQLGRGVQPSADFTDRLIERANVGLEKAPVEAPEVTPEPIEPVNAPMDVMQEGIQGSFEMYKTAVDRYLNVSDTLNDLRAQVARGEIAADDPQIAARESELMGELFQIQMIMQRAQFGIELMSKVVEHGTGGMRTVLQTQA